MVAPLNANQGPDDDQRDDEPSEALEKSADADLLREMIGFAAHRLMELEIESLTGGAHGERSSDRITHRYGYREWETCAGTVALACQSCTRKPSHL